MLLSPDNTGSRNTENLRIYLEKECFTETEWSNELFFKASIDEVTHQNKLSNMAIYEEDINIRKMSLILVW